VGSTLTVVDDKEGDDMSHQLIAGEETAVEIKAQPVFERIPVDPFVPCDGHASQAIQALVSMLTPEGAEVYLCGNHARKAGWDHVSRANQVAEVNRQQGSDH